MNDILNLTVKKEVFESICNGTSDEIYINRSKWWDKRMIEESGEPKDFRIVSISSGDSGKFDFPIWTIDIQKKCILVKIARVKEKEEKVEEVENTPTPKVELTQEMFNELWKSAIHNDEETGEDEDEDVDENEQSDEDEDEYVDPKDLTPKTKSIDVNDGIMEMFDKFCENKDVYLVPTPFATIKPNGKIVGTDRSLNLNMDVEMRIAPTKLEFVHLKTMSDKFYYNTIKTGLSQLLDKSIVLIWKNKCKFSKVASGEDVFVIYYASKKKYLLKRY